jgi:hypothetical protein
MGLSRDPRAARAVLRDKACPLCGERAWDFEGARVVFLVDARDGERLADYNRLRLGGPSLTGLRRGGGDAESALRQVSDQLKPVRDAASRNRLVQIACNNCGHTELLDASKAGA